MNFINIPWWTQSQNQIFPIAFAIVIVASILIGVLLKDKAEKIKNIPFLIITILLIVAEIIKQVRAINAGYNLWSIPLHYCSTFLIWFTIASLTSTKIRKVGHKIAYATTTAFFVSFLIGPTTIIGNATDNLAFTWSNFGSLHTFYYHFAIVLFLALQITLKYPFPTLKDFKVVVIPFFSWMAVASIMANLLDVNFSNLLYNNIAFMDSIRLNLGYPVYLISMFLTFFLLCVGILAFGSLLRVLKPNKIN